MIAFRYWASEMDVDGFRFDLASVFMRDDAGNLNYQDPAIISAINADATLAGLRLIAEPWQGELGGGYVWVVDTARDSPKNIIYHRFATGLGRGRSWF